MPSTENMVQWITIKAIVNGPDLESREHIDCAPGEHFNISKTFDTPVIP